jgi:outer membrane immunogenic protein
MMAPPFTWTGCYFGGNAGGLFAKKDWSTAGGAVESSFDISSWLAGAQVGCNYQMGAVVFGVQGDYDWSNASGSATDGFFIATTDQVTVKSLASVTGRIGYAWDRFMFYGKGGGAWVNDNYTVSAPGFAATASETRTGWTVGAGGEYAFTDWLTGFVEYDYYDFGTKSDSFVPVFALSNIKQTVSVAKGGINIKFGSWWH